MKRRIHYVLGILFFLIVLMALPGPLAANTSDTWTGEKVFGKGRDVPYVPTPMRIIETMFRLAGLTDKDFVIDLGCGDGRIVIAAAKRGARGIGIDIDPERIQECRENARQEGVTRKVTFLKQDLFTTDISRASVVTMYLLPSVNLQLRPRLLSELKPGTRIVSHDFDMGEWEADKRAPNVYFWVVPANISGRWKLDMAEIKEPEMFLELEQKFQKVSGKLLLGDIEYPVRNADLVGDKLDFTVSTPDHSRILHYTFTISDEAMLGKMESTALLEPVTIKAQREPGTKKRIDE